MIAFLARLFGGGIVSYVAAFAAGLAVLAAAYHTGTNAERKRGEAATLRQTVAALERQRDSAIAIQTTMAERLSEVRAENEQRRNKADVVVQAFRSEPVDRRCLLSDAERLRLQSIRVGPARANP